MTSKAPARKWLYCHCCRMSHLFVLERVALLPLRSENQRECGVYKCPNCLTERQIDMSGEQA